MSNSNNTRIQQENLTQDDIERIYDEMILAITSPLFIDICEQLGIPDVKETIEQTIYQKGKTKKDIAERLYNELAKKHSEKYFKELNKKECQTVLELMESHFKEQIVGQDELLHMLLIALTLNEHALLEGLPGVGKTVIVKWIAHVTGLPFSRIQFIPDMLPSDLIGKDRIILERLQSQDPRGATEWVNGPVFSSLVLADEINRAPSKVQAALLESMGENQVTPFGKTARSIYNNIHAAVLKVWQNKSDTKDRGIFGLPSIPIQRSDLAQFTVFATMNPIEQEGTYPLSEAQIDRFCFKIVVPYPSRYRYEDISKIILSREKKIYAIEGKLPVEKYEQFFNEHGYHYMIPVLIPIYFFLRCRSYIIPVFMREQDEKNKGKDKNMYQEKQLGKGNTLYEKFHKNQEDVVHKLHDIVFMTNAKSVSAGYAGSMRSHFELEQIEMYDYIEDEKNKRNYMNRYQKLKDIFDLPQCQFTLAGASPRGLASLEIATLCETFIRGSDSVKPCHITAVIKNVLRHRIHMDVHARLAGITSSDVIENVCSIILREK